MVLLTVAAGNVQGFAYLKSQGYRVNVTAVTVITGLTTVINSLFGGHPAAVGQIAVAYAAGPEAGPAEHRYWAIVLPSIGAILIAYLAGTAIALASAMPASFVLTIGGLAMLPIVQKALGAAFGSELRFGPTVAFVVAATPFAVAGLSAGLLALVFGIAASASGRAQGPARPLACERLAGRRAVPMAEASFSRKRRSPPTRQRQQQKGPPAQ
jgi:benzoate membrane transport protein